MLTLILVILAILASIYAYQQRGCVAQAVQVLGMAVAYILARMFYLPLAARLELWIPYPGYSLHARFVYYPRQVLTELDTVYYRAVAFCLIIFAVWLVKCLILYLINPSKYYGRNTKGRKIGAIIVGTLSVCFVCFFFFALLSLIGFPPVQRYLAGNLVADFFIRWSPILSRQVFSWWFKGIASLGL